MGFIDFSEHLFRKFHLLQYFRCPFSVRNVQKLHGGGVGDFRRIFTSQAISQIILGQVDVCHLLVEFRFVVLHPLNLCCCKARSCGCQRILHEEIIPYDLPHMFTGFGRSSVVPQDGTS